MDRVDADLIEVDEHGNEKWYVRMWVGGKDEEGVYERVLEGPAEGERVYVGPDA